MEFGQLMINILVNVSCTFEMYIFKIAQVINENVCIAFLYVLSKRLFFLFKEIRLLRFVFTFSGNEFYKWANDRRCLYEGGQNNY